MPRLCHRGRGDPARQDGVKVTGTTASAILAELRDGAGKTAAAVRTCRVLLQPTVPTPSPTPSPGS